MERIALDLDQLDINEAVAKVKEQIDVSTDSPIYAGFAKVKFEIFEISQFLRIIMPIFRPYLNISSILSNFGIKSRNNFLKN